MISGPNMLVSVFRLRRQSNSHLKIDANTDILSKYCFFFSPDGDACKSIPCANKGHCKDGIGTYTCFCPSGYKGFNCEIGKQVENVHKCYICGHLF